MSAGEQHSNPSNLFSYLKSLVQNIERCGMNRTHSILSLVKHEASPTTSVADLVSLQNRPVTLIPGDSS